jgi:hypothetical protein
MSELMCTHALIYTRRYVRVTPTVAVAHPMDRLARNLDDLRAPSFGT